MVKDDYVRFRCTSAQKSIIFSRAHFLNMSVTDYLMRCVYFDCSGNNQEDFVMVPVSRRYLDMLLPGLIDPASDAAREG